MALHVIQGGPPPDKPALKSAKASKPAEMVQCARCTGREVIETVIGGMMQGGKLKGGTRQVVCVGCLLKGERVVLG